MPSSVSTIIPVYNDADTLPRAIDSVLRQTHEVDELIVVDDCSEDSPEAVIEQYNDDRITFRTHEQNRGGSAARNTGIEVASSEYLAFLDADDEWKSTKIEKQLSVLQSRTGNWVVVYCDIENHRDFLSELGDRLAKVIGNRDSNPAKEGDLEVICEILRMNLHMSSSSLLIKTETVDTIDGFDERFQRHQDWEFLIRVLQQGKIAYVDEPLVIKHGTGRPSASVHEEAKQLYLNKFSEEIEQLESDGEHIIHYHKLRLARMFLEDGKLIEGIKRLRIRSTTDVLSVLWSLSLGIYKKVRSALPS